MMKEKYLKELQEALENENIQNIDGILKLYQSRFELGYEAGMTDEEIIAQFKSIEEIIEENMDEDLKEPEPSYEGELDLSIFSDFKIIRKDETGIHFEIEERAKEYIELSIRDKKVCLSTKDKSIFTKKYRPNFEGKMFIGSNVSFSSLLINNINCDVDICSLNCENLKISNVNGDLNLEGVECGEEFTLHNTNGDIKIMNLVSQQFKVGTVNGDIQIKELCCDGVNMSTVSGDIVIDRSNDSVYSLKSVSGDISIKSGLSMNNVSAISISGTVKVGGQTVKGDLNSKIKEAMSKIVF